MSVVATEPKVIKVKMAGIDFAKGPEALETLLGSCVGVAVWDRRSKLGGLAHVVLPQSRGDTNLPGKFADTAVAELKRQLLSRGASPSTLTAKIAGGATMFGQRTERDVGEKNYQAVLEQLRRHGIRVVAEHIGGGKGRMIRFSLADGTVEVSIARQVVAML
ncbi:MAG TPA: chemotaxis protein CheD [Thermoguttaceae bacterium]|nr:chemotaxis protein CheD [Thermoguttaceae bacterium]